MHLHHSRAWWQAAHKPEQYGRSGAAPRGDRGQLPPYAHHFRGTTDDRPIVPRPHTDLRSHRGRTHHVMNVFDAHTEPAGRTPSGAATQGRVLR
ncbi:hypothetical protein GCM10010388_06150 [Streptomyces mauvecolor]